MLCANFTIIKFELVWEKKYVTIIYFIDAIEKLKFGSPSLKRPSSMKLIFLSFFSEQCSNPLKDLFS